MPKEFEQSHHAETRRQQRGISQAVIDVVLAYGTVVYQGGSKRCVMDRKARLRAQRELDPKAYRRIVDRLDTYLVVDGPKIITTAKLSNRMRFLKPDRPTKRRRRLDR